MKEKKSLLDRFSDESEQDKNSDNLKKLLSFRVNGRLYAISIENVAEIIGIQGITYVPCLPGYVKGVTNVRGKVVPLIALRLRFDNPGAEYTDKTCIVIVETEDASVGYIVDEISDVLKANESKMVDKLPGSDYAAKYVSGMMHTDSDVVLLLDNDKIIDPGELSISI